MTTREGRKKLIKSKKTNNEKLKKSVTYQWMKLWNSLTIDIQKQPNNIAFKSALKTHLAELELKHK